MEMEITADAIDEICNTALEEGSNYWLGLPEIELEKCREWFEKSKLKRLCFSTKCQVIITPHSDANTVEVPRFCGLSTSKYFHNHLDRTTKLNIICLSVCKRIPSYKYLCHVSKGTELDRTMEISGFQNRIMLRISATPTVNFLKVRCW